MSGQIGNPVYLVFDEIVLDKNLNFVSFIHLFSGKVLVRLCLDNI